MQTPFPISGTILDINSNAIESAIVEVHNLRNGELLTTKTNSSGEYILDLVNLTSDYVDNDKILVRAYQGGTLFKFKESEQTVDTTTGSLTVNLTLVPEFPVQPKDNDDKVLQRKEHHTSANAKKVVQVTPDGKDINPNNPLPVRQPDFNDLDNSTIIPLPADTGGIDHIFTGTAINITDASQITVSIKTDADSATNGLIIEQGKDGINWDVDDTFTINADSGEVFNPNKASNYMRVRYINGTSAQTYIRLNTIINYKYILPNSHKISDTIVNEDDAQLVKSIIAADSGDGTTMKNINVQHPLPVDGDQVYEKDLDQERSTTDGWTGGTVIGLVNDSWSTLVNSNATNPKVILMQMKRPLQTNILGIATPIGNFSNTKITAIIGVGDSEIEQVILDESSDNTKKTILIPNIIPTTLIALKIEFYTADTCTLSALTISKAHQRISRIQGTSVLTSLTEDVSTYRGVLNVNSAWVHRKIVNETYHQETGTSTNPTVAITAGDITITVASVVDLAVGSEIKLEEEFAGLGVQEIGLMTITVIAGNDITLDRPVGNDYTIAADIIEVTSNMAVAGTLASPQIFEIDPPLGTIWQFTRVLLAITDATAPDDGKFGGMAVLTNGVSLRATTAAGRTVVFANWKNNGDMKLDMFDVAYTDKAPAGNHGVNGRWTFTKAEVVAELDGDSSPLQKLEILIQDDLTDLITFTMRGQGRVESP